MPRWLIGALALLVSTAAHAQSSPNLRTGQVPTAAQWNSYFAAKQDLFAYTPLNRAGDAMQGPLATFPNTANLSGFVITPSPAPPATPQEGAVWVTTAGMYLYVNGATQGPFAATSGVLGLTSGGTGASLTASNGGLVYSTGSALAILSGTATAGQIPRSGSSAAPSWSTATFPATTAAGTVLASSSANVVAGTATPTLGANGGTGGSVTLNGSTSGSAVIRTAAAAGTGTIFQLPATNGVNGDVLTVNGSGVTSWTTLGSGVTSIAGNSGAFTLSGLLTNSTNDLRVTAATQAEMEAATSSTTAVTPQRAQNHPGVAKAWAFCTASGASYTLSASYNISGATCGRTGAGVGTLTFSTAFSGATAYGCVGTTSGGGGQMAYGNVTKTTTQVSYDVRDGTGTNSDITFMLTCFGDQ